MNSFEVEIRPSGIAILTFNLQGSAVNVLSRAVLAEFRGVLHDVIPDPHVRGCVLRSGKAGAFIAGADLREIAGIRHAAEASAFVRDGHELLDMIAASPKPFVAAIDGAALGGGLEIALACHRRLVTDDPRTTLALPEVMVGLIPAGGGTQRLPRLVGLPAALSMMLTGRKVSVAEALRSGLVDAVVERADLLERAESDAIALHRGNLQPRRRPKSLGGFVANLPAARTAVLKNARETVMRKSGRHYPAPFAILDAVESGLSKGFAKGQEKEIELFGRLVVTPEGRNLIWIFEASRELKKAPDADEARPVKKLGVIGAGLMGEGIVSVSLPIVPVIVKDVSAAAIDRVTTNIERSLGRRTASGALSEDDRRKQIEHLAVTTEMQYLRATTIVIEAVFEDLDLKRSVLAEVEEVVSERTVFASNTSALPIAKIAGRARHPERVLGMHYFSPVPKMPLLEIVAAPATAPWAIATARAFGIAQGKSVIVVKDGPGFYTTRILAPLLNEAVLLLEEGASIEAIDRAMRGFGFPVGPIALIDEVGIGVGAHVSRNLGQAFAARGLSGSDLLSRMHSAGYEGRKNGRGFYLYPPDGKKQKKESNSEVYSLLQDPERRPVSAEEIVSRLSLVMINEVAHCLGEGIIESPRDGDLGAIFGLGFPPFLGGPFHLVDARGAAEIVASMRALEERCGLRFRPAPLLEQYASESRKFYPEGPEES
ncbi:MAG: 3-hydroxyacyl-CoA dehydrogenase NAD-binding domain-containing protein [Thermoanaerobaculia bacterium]